MLNGRVLDSREEESLPATPPSQPIGDNLALERRSLLVNGMRLFSLHLSRNCSFKTLVWFFYL